MTELSTPTESVSSGEYERMKLSVHNIGGIEQCDVSFSPDVTILEGRNATNRTSLLTAITDVLGGSPAAMKTDASRGSVALQLDGTSYSRTYERNNGSLVSRGEQYSEHRSLVDLFVSLLERNAVRRAVEQGGNLRDLLLEPVDTEQIERQLHQTEKRREEIDRELASIESERERLPTLEERRTDLQEEREALEREIETLSETIEAHEGSEEEVERAEALLDELDSHRQRLSSTEANIAQQDDQLESIREVKASAEAALESLSVPATELETLEDELSTLRREERTIDNRISDLQHIIRFNDDLLSGSESSLPELTPESTITDELDPDQQLLECWTCGTEIERKAIASRLDELRSVITEYREKRMELSGDIDRLEARISEVSSSVNKRDSLEQDIKQAEEEMAIREEKRDDLTAQREAILSDIEDIEQRVEETEELRESDLVEQYQQLSELQYNRGQIDQDLSRVEEEIARLDALSAEKEALLEQREETAETITTLRSRISDLEEQTVEEFNGHMETLLDSLEFDNITRVWIERKTSGKATNDSTFELHIVRQTADGSVYDDTVQTLSESEREVIGLVVALTGYLAHHVYENVPVMLLDSLEAIDANRLDTLIGYFSQYVPFLIVALLPEDAAVLSDEYDRITAKELAS